MNRWVYAAAFFCVIGLGLASRHYPGIFPTFLGKYPGDALWAVMVFCALGFLFPGYATVRLAAFALLISYLDEFSQRYHATWIDDIRRTGIGHLILGSEFSWIDMLSYTVGVALVIPVDIILRAAFRRIPQ